MLQILTGPEHRDDIATSSCRTAVVAYQAVNSPLHADPLGHSAMSRSESVLSVYESHLPHAPRLDPPPGAKSSSYPVRLNGRFTRPSALLTQSRPNRSSN